MELAGSNLGCREAREKMCDLRVRDVWLTDKGLPGLIFFAWPDFVVSGNGFVGVALYPAVPTNLICRGGWRTAPTNRRFLATVW